MKVNEQFQNNINNEIKESEIEKYSKNLKEMQNDDSLYNQIIECEELLKQYRKTDIQEEEELSNNKNLLLLIEEIENNLLIKIKNELPIIVYIILQKSINNEAEKIFNKQYLDKITS